MSLQFAARRDIPALACRSTSSCGATCQGEHVAPDCREARHSSPGMSLDELVRSDMPRRTCRCGLPRGATFQPWHVARRAREGRRASANASPHVRVQCDTHRRQGRSTRSWRATCEAERVARRSLLERHSPPRRSPHSTGECDMDAQACRCTQVGEATFTRVMRDGAGTGTARREIADHVLALGEHHVRRILRETLGVRPDLRSSGIQSSSRGSRAGARSSDTRVRRGAARCRANCRECGFGMPDRAELAGVAVATREKSAELRRRSVVRALSTSSISGSRRAAVAGGIPRASSSCSRRHESRPGQRERRRDRRCMRRHRRRDARRVWGRAQTRA
jgi:hypothetical protein